MTRSNQSRKLTVFPTSLAYCYASSLMRPFLRHKPTILAILVVAVDDMAGHFESALEIIFEGKPLYGVRRAADGASIRLISTGNSSRNQIIGTAQGGDKHAVLIFTNEADVPAEYKDAADLYHVVREFSPRHFVGAVYRICGDVVTDKDAGYLKTIALDRLMAAFRRGRPAFRSLQILRRADAGAVERSTRDIAANEDPIGVEDLIGYGPARDWGLQLLKDFKHFNDGSIAWRDVDPGLLLSGPTGTGKTSFAKALAHSSGVPLIHGSVAQWQSEGHLGDMLRAMRAKFHEAVEQAPSILLIDEIDSLGDRNNFRGEYGHYSRQVVNGALELMDGALGRPGVILIATTNHPDQVDSALLRPGRLDHHIRVALPDEQARIAILEQRLEIDINEDVAHSVAELTDDWTGAQLGQLCRRARRRARVQDRQVSVEDIIPAMPDSVAVSKDRLRTTAVHEAGHAIVGLALGMEIERIKIADRYLADAGSVSLGSVHFRRDRDARRDLQHYLAETCVLLGGVAAEGELFDGHDDGAGGTEGSDLRVATRVATMIECSFGMGKTLVSEADTEPGLTALRFRDSELWGRVHNLLNAQMSKTREIIRANRSALDHLTEALIERKRITGAELAELLSENSHEVTLPAQDITPQFRGKSQ
ncbi:AAA family ATPase [Rhizobium rhododendri]|uniref:AAA family ATPase n=1 Tax=Rhizobium rhododendri TaxID=2506430 RepID=A0ABY8IKM8_9HYPH|nr:AAA family ATPase [Rhizobium rhododendri]WFS23917.1 AAA family ATPase [Rhizobium rhododendri]